MRKFESKLRKGSRKRKSSAIGIDGNQCEEKPRKRRKKESTENDENVRQAEARRLEAEKALENAVAEKKAAEKAAAKKEAHRARREATKESIRTQVAALSAFDRTAMQHLDLQPGLKKVQKTPAKTTPANTTPANTPAKKTRVKKTPPAVVFVQPAVACRQLRASELQES